MYGKNNIVFQSVSTSNDRAPLVPKNTAGHGDCPFHAMLGEWDVGEGKFVCTDVAKKRKQVADVIRRCLTSERLFRFIEKAIHDLIVDKRTVNGKRLQEAQKQYQKYLDSHSKILSSAWVCFEKELIKNSELIILIESYFDDYCKKNELSRGEVRIRA